MIFIGNDGGHYGKQRLQNRSDSEILIYIGERVLR